MRSWGGGRGGSCPILFYGASLFLETVRKSMPVTIEEENNREEGGLLKATLTGLFRFSCQEEESQDRFAGRDSNPGLLCSR
jgi:hypothetical protein